MSEDNYNRINDIQSSPFGIGYKFTLTVQISEVPNTKESVDNVPEYLSPTETLRSLCQEYHLQIEQKINFLKYIRRMVPKYEHEYLDMNVPNMEGGLTKDEIEVAQLYCVLVLRKEENTFEEGSYEQLENAGCYGKFQNDICTDDIICLDFLVYFKF